LISGLELTDAAASVFAVPPGARRLKSPLTGAIVDEPANATTSPSPTTAKAATARAAVPFEMTVLTTCRD
jgi:hypothetical protein